MSTRQDPTEQLLDLLVYAPLGLLLEARDLVPKLADKGRRRLGGQVTVARMIGELAVRQGQRRAEKVVQAVREHHGWTPAARPGSSTAASPANGHGPSPADPADPPASTSAATATRPAPPEGGAGSLAVPGYDTLSASQVVPRLEGLSSAERDAVRRYEAAHRGRKTILNKLQQLA